MGKKLIYLIRHGETVLNAQGIRQGSEGPLTDRGREQARAVAKRFPKKRGKPQVLISSPFERTRETAGIIAEELGMQIEYNDLLVERRNPSEIIGRSSKDPQVAYIVDTIDKSFHDDNLRYSDEENFADLKARAKKLLAYIRTRKERRIVMVTHSIFLQMVVAYMLYGDKLTASKYATLRQLNPIGNASMTIVQYIPHWFSRPEWRVLMWDDQAEQEGYNIRYD